MKTRAEFDAEWGAVAAALPGELRANMVHIAGLLAAERAYVDELVAALPRCNVASGCPRIGVYEWHGEDLACDEHCPPNRANGYDLPYAGVIRRLGL